MATALNLNFYKIPLQLPELDCKHRFKTNAYPILEQLKQIKGNKLNKLRYLFKSTIEN